MAGYQDYGQPDPTQPRKAALMQALNGGAPGTTAGPGLAQPQPASPPAELGAAPAPVAAAADPFALGQYGNRLEGFDSTKLASKSDPKYDIGRTLSQFDPRAGVTPDVLAALNKLNIGQFSGSGDKVSIANGDPRFGPVHTLDLVRGFHDPNGTGGWQYGVQDNEVGATPQPQAGGARPAFTGSTIGAPLQGDAQAGIQQALAQLSQSSNGDYIQQLIARMQQGAQ